MRKGRLASLARLIAILSSGISLIGVCLAYIYPETGIYILMSIALLAGLSILGVFYSKYAFNKRMEDKVLLVWQCLQRYNEGDMSYLEAVKASGLLLGEFNKIIVDNKFNVNVNLGFMEKDNERCV